MSRRRVGVWLSVMCVLSVFVIGNVTGDASAAIGTQRPQIAMTEASTADVTAKMATMHVPFIANHGQMNESVAFYANTLGGDSIYHA